MATGHISSVGSGFRIHIYCIVSMNYNCGSSTRLSTILHVVVVVQSQLNILYMLVTHPNDPSLQDYERHIASGLSSSDDNVGHAANQGGL